MAREKAADRRAREAAEQEQRMAAREAAYPQFFREVVSAALNENFELNKVDATSGEYTFYDRDESEQYTIYDTFGLAGQSEWSLIRLEDAVKYKVERRQEREREMEERRVALAKLTDKERKLLGV